MQIILSRQRLQKAEILTALYNYALHSCSKHVEKNLVCMSVSDAAFFLMEKTYFTDVNGYFLGIDLGGDRLDCRLYNGHYGENAVSHVLCLYENQKKERLLGNIFSLHIQPYFSYPCYAYPSHQSALAYADAYINVDREFMAQLLNAKYNQVGLVSSDVAPAADVFYQRDIVYKNSETLYAYLEYAIKRSSSACLEEILCKGKIMPGALTTVNALLGIGGAPYHAGQDDPLDTWRKRSLVYPLLDSNNADKLSIVLTSIFSQKNPINVCRLVSYACEKQFDSKKVYALVKAIDNHIPSIKNKKTQNKMRKMLLSAYHSNNYVVLVRAMDEAILACEQSGLCSNKKSKVDQLKQLRIKFIEAGTSLEKNTSLKKFILTAAAQRPSFFRQAYFGDTVSLKAFYSSISSEDAKKIVHQLMINHSCLIPANLLYDFPVFQSQVCYARIRN